MKLIFVTLFLIFYFCKVFGQLELTTGYAVNKSLADGAPLHVAYDFKIKDRFYTKPQIGYKYLYYFDDFVGAKLKTYIWEIHQTVSYEFVKRKKFIFKPNIGLNYRFYKLKGEMVAPLNTLPVRALVMGVRNGNFILVSRDGESKKDYVVGNFGFTIHLQSQFKLNEKLWLHVTPFLEPDYDRIQNTGGCYVGVIFKNL